MPSAPTRQHPRAQRASRLANIRGGHVAGRRARSLRLLRGSLKLLCLCSAGAVAVGCGARQATGTTGHHARKAETIQSEGAARKAQRMLWKVGLESAEASALQRSLSAYYTALAIPLIANDDYDAVAALFRRTTRLYSPAQLERGAFTSALGPLADYLYEYGSRRGDEARVLSALFVRARLAERPEADRTAYAELLAWGEEVRATLGSEVDSLSGRLDVATEHSNLLPAESVLQQVAALMQARRTHILQLIKDTKDATKLASPDLFRQNRSALPLLARAPLDVAAVFMEHGDMQSAVEEVRKLEASGPAQGRLVAALVTASQTDDKGLAARFELATALSEQRPELTLGLCRSALPIAPLDPRFRLCLARVASLEQRLDDASAWYRDAVDLAPDNRELYDEALERLAVLVQQGLFDTDSEQARGVASITEALLKERIEGWPDIPPTVAPAALYLLFGMLDMNAGDVVQARERFELSLAESPTPDVLLQLGLLEARLGNFKSSTEHLSAAVKLAEQDPALSPGKRAEFVEQLADIQRRSTGIESARATYEHALSLWSEAGDELTGPGLAMFHVRRGIIFDRLANTTSARREFQSAMDAAPGWREPYASLLAHLLVSSGDVQLASYVFRQANRKLTLEPEWKVYFGLWVQNLAQMRNESVPKGLDDMLKELAKGPGWWAKLAGFSTGMLQGDALISAANTRGEKAEACFYVALAKLQDGQSSAASALLKKVIETNMVSYYEFVMAGELLDKLHPGSGAADKAAGLRRTSR